MKTIGLIGGMSWESSAEYYNIINREVQKRLGGSHSAECLLYSFDFQRIETLQHDGEWGKLTAEMISVARGLKNAGADFVVICTNTMHIMAEDIEKHAEIEVLHIADATALEMRKQGIRTAGLLGTRFTMEKDFYKKRIREKFGIEVIIPSEEDMETVHGIIYSELVRGIIRDESRTKFLTIIEKLREEGAEAIILGCTEIPLLVKAEHTEIPLFSTSFIHSLAAVEKALGE